MQSFPRNRNDSVLRLVLVKFRRIRKAVSPVIAVLLMIAIAVIAAILAYMWVTGYIKFTTTKTGKAIQIQSASYTGTHLLVYVQNVGKGTVRFVAGQCLYLDGVLREKATMTRDSLLESETVTMTENISLYLGQTIKIKVVTDEGTSVEEYFTVNVFTGDYTLTVRIVGNGRVEPSGGAYFDDNIQLNAIPDDHWVFSGWSGDVSGTANPVDIYMNESKDVTATFVAIQHQITFYQSGVGSDFAGTVITVDGNGYGLTDLPKSFLWGEASTHSFSFASPLTVDTGKRYVWTSTSGDSAQQSDSQFVVPNGDGGVTGNYGIQFYLTVDNGGHGTGNGQDWYNASSPATFSIGPTTVSGAAGTQYVFTGWAGSGSGSYTGTDVSYSITMNNPINETAQWKTQYEVTFDAKPSDEGTTTPIPGTRWYDAGDVSISATPTNSSYGFTSWTATGSITFANSSSASTTATISGSGTITANFGLHTVQITIASDPERLDCINVDGTNYTTPQTFTWTISETHALEALSQVLGPAGTRYVFTSWSDGEAQTHNYTVPSSSGTVVANYKTQYEVTFNQTGLDDTSTGTVVMIGGITKTRAELPFTDWFDDGTVYNYNAVVSSRDPDREFTLIGVTPASPITSSGTVMGSYKAWFYITFDQSGVDSGLPDTVVTIDGLGYRASSLPTHFWWDDSSIHSFAFQSPLIVSSGDQYNWANTTGLSTLQSGSLTVSTSGTVTGTYVHQILDHFDFDTISSPQMAGTVFNITITAKDASGNTVTSYNGINTLTDSTGTIIPSSTGTFMDGVWTGSITITKLATGVTISTSGSSKTGVSNAFDVNAGALDHFAFETINSPQTAGTAFSTTITAKDAYGNTVASYVGAATLAYSAGTISPTTTGIFTNGVWSGSVTVTALGTGATITATDSGKTGTSNPFDVKPGALASFTITGYPTSVTAGQSFGGVTITAYDAYGNVKTDYVGQVYFTSTDGAADLPYTSGSRYMFTSGAGMDNGVHMFLGFTLNTAGSRTITVTDGSKFATSNSITVNAAHAPYYYTALTPTSAQVGASVSFAYTITRQSGSGYNVGWATIQVPAGFTGITVTSVTASSGQWDSLGVSGNTITVNAHSSGSELSSGSAYVTVVFTTTAPLSPGTYGPFVSTAYEHRNQGGSGPGTLQNSGGSDPTVIVYVPGVLDHFTITGYPSSTTAGQNFDSNNVVVRAYDGGDNILTGYTGQVYFVSTDSQAILPYTSGSKYTFVSGDNGVHTFAGTGFTLKTAGSQTITVTDGSVFATSNSITVNPAAAAKLVYTVGAGQSLVVGQVSTQITVQRQDQYGNPTTSGEIQVNLATNSVGGGFYSNSGGTTSINHVHIYDGASTTSSFYYKDMSAGTPTLTASSGSLTPATTQFTIQLPKANPDIASSFTPHSGIQPGNQVIDTAKLVNATADAGGSFTYKLYSGVYPSGTQIDSDTKTVTNGVVPDSKAFTVSAQGPYYFIAEYSGDSNNNAMTTYSPESFVAWPSAQTVLLRPNGDTSDRDLEVYPPSTPHYQCVNQVSSDGDATYVYNILTNFYTDDTYYLPDLSFPSGIINYVTIHAVARTTGYGSTQLSLTTHGNEYDGTDNPGYPFPLTSGWLEYTAMWPTNPSTGNTWTIQEINDLLVGCSLYSAVSGGARCTQVYVEVYYTPMQQVTFVSAGTGSGTTNGNPTPGYPTGLQANDLILLQVTVRGDSTPTITPPAGFALLYGPDATGGSGSSGGERVTQWIYYKFSTGSESGTSTVTITGTNYDRAARMYAFRNVAPSSFTESASFGYGNDDVILAQSVTTSGGGRMAVSFVSVENDISVGSFTGESGGDWTEAVSEYTFNGDDDLCMQLQIATMASAGTISGGSYDTGSTSYRWGVRAFALIPLS